ncbi:hypothetical protein EYR40_005094 [Pleurotus pulmonarius]|nr:hypothetical protein EYR36_006532 [Pleurotus pulmonarius]KAF4601230.1 hypothetical protein EYR38_005882 [Pleurotus pulmonarius]KAF4601894.1 hypothetical protein EYR40_005094 [Pleurotus pulmonarius]
MQIANDDEHSDEHNAQMIHLEHHKILPAWDGLPPHDDSSFNSDSFLSDSPNPKPASNFSAQQQQPETNPQSITQSSDPAESDPAESHTSPPQPPSTTNPQDGSTGVPSPVGDDRSSSLSPLPEAGSPQTTHNEATSSPASAPTSKEDDEAASEKPSSVAIKTGLEQSSRQSTPLSEPPDQEDDADPSADNLKEGMQEESAGAQTGEANGADTKETKPPEGAQSGKGSGGRGGGSTAGDVAAAPTWNKDSATTNDSHSVLPSPVAPSPTSNIPQASDPKVVAVLELNVELLKVFMEIQTRGMPMADPVPSQYYARLQSNLAWLAAAADQSRQGNHSQISLPMMDPPSPVDFAPNERIRQLYSDLPSVFAKEMARRQQAVLSSVNASSALSSPVPPSAPATTNPMPNTPSTPNPSVNHLKRDRPHDAHTPSEQTSIKRRDTGESKPNFGAAVSPSPAPSTPSHNNLGPPNAGNIGNNMYMNQPNAMPSTPNTAQLGLGMPNGATGGSGQGGSPAPFPMGPLGTNLVNTAEAQLAATNRDRARQAQIRAAQQQHSRQMSPSSASGMPNNQMGGQMPNAAMNNVPGASSPSANANGSGNMMNMNMGNGNASQQGQSQSGGGMSQQNFQAMYQLLQTPNHPFVNYMVRNVQGFAHLPLQAQLQKMMVAQNVLQQQQRERANMANASGGMSPTTSMSGHQFQGQANMSPVSPVANSPSIPQGAQGAGFPTGSGNMGQGGMDPRMQIPQGMNMNNLSAQQRQLYLLQQQARAGGGGGAGGNNNPQAMMLALQQQERMRQQMGQQGQATSPTIGSPMSGNMPDISSLRSNNGIPGIARSARSPSDNAPSPMTPRVPTRGPSLGQEDYQRMLMAQQAQQANRIAAQSPIGFGQQSQAAWQQNQMQQQQGMGNQGGYGGAGSPSIQQNWSQQQQGGYPFVSSPGGDHPQAIRHMSGTPGPQNSNPQSDSGMVVPPDFNDLLDWPQ